MRVGGFFSLVLAVDWAAVGAVAGVVGVIVAVVVPIGLQRWLRNGEDGATGTPSPAAQSGLSEQRIAALSQRLTEYTGVIYKMNLEQNSPEGRKKNFTPQYMEWAHREDQLRSEIFLMLDPAKPQQARLIDALESFGREADIDEPWIRRKDRLLEVAQQVYAAEGPQ